MKRYLLGFALSLLAIGSPAPSFASASYDDGVRAYQAGNYQEAAVKFARASGEEPTSAMAHYYLANSLAKVHQHIDAAQEYRLALALDPNGPVAEFCRQALKGYKTTVPDEGELKALRATVSSAGVRQRSASAQPPRVAHSEPVEKSLTVIRRELEYEKKKNASMSGFTEEEVMAQAQDQIKTAKARLEARIAALPSEYSRKSIGAQEEIRYREMQLRNAERDEEDMIMRNAQSTVERYKKVGDMKSSALDQVVQNLESQMSESGRRGGVKLIPQGTDLYVRQYASARGAAPEVHPAVVRIYGQPYGGIDVPPQRADESQARASTASTSVRGKVIKPEPMHDFGSVQL